MTKAADAELRFVGRFQDVIWGPIPHTQLEVDLVNTRPLARLNNIRQMGLASLDYHGLLHSRLQHSIGVMHVADALYTSLMQTRRLDSKAYIRLFSPSVRQAVRVAALLHDLGHPPFSHAVELTFLRFPSVLDPVQGYMRKKPGHLTATLGMDERVFSAYSHEAFTLEIIKSNGELGSLLDDRLPDIAVEDIAALAVGRARDDRLQPFNGLISGDFDADKIDYLIRDNHHSGFSVGLSPDELYKALHLLPDKGGQRRYTLYIDKTALPFVNRIISSRDRLVQRVHLAPAGRSATQMMTHFLAEDLGAADDPVELAKTVHDLHCYCTDFTFFERIRQQLERGAGRWSDFQRLVRQPSKENVWREYGHLGFAKMHPCLRLMAYICAAAGYDGPSSLTFDTEGARIVLEPSTRPAPKYTLMVNFDSAGAAEPGLDFLGCAENREGRAILAGALSRLDLFGYKVGGTGGKEAERVLVPSDGGAPYAAGLSPEERLLAEAVVGLSSAVREGRAKQGKGLFPDEFLLALLYFLEQNVRRTYGALKPRAIYVYRGEYFINVFLADFLRAGCAEEFFPEEFREGRPDGATINANKVFNELQRLEVFGLVETRRRPVFHQSKVGVRVESGRTLANVYSTRSDFRISYWGKAYVESLLDQRELQALEECIDSRQGKATEYLTRMARLQSATAREGGLKFWGHDRVEHLRRFEAEWEAIAEELREQGACAMIFTIAEESGADATGMGG